MPDESNDMSIERALRAVTPTQVRIDPIAAAFAAGRGSARRQVRIWQSSTAAVILLGAASWLVQPGEHPSPIPAAPTVAMMPAAASWRSSQSLIVLQRAVLDRGVDGLPRTDVPATTIFRTSDSL